MVAFSLERYCHLSSMCKFHLLLILLTFHLKLFKNIYICMQSSVETLKKEKMELEQELLATRKDCNQTLEKLQEAETKCLQLQQNLQRCSFISLNFEPSYWTITLHLLFYNSKEMWQTCQMFFHVFFFFFHIHWFVYFSWFLFLLQGGVV